MCILIQQHSFHVIADNIESSEFLLKPIINIWLHYNIVLFKLKFWSINSNDFFRIRKHIVESLEHYCSSNFKDVVRCMNLWASSRQVLNLCNNWKVIFVQKFRVVTHVVCGVHQLEIRADHVNNISLFRSTPFFVVSWKVVLKLEAAFSTFNVLSLDVLRRLILTIVRLVCVRHS